MKFVVNKSCNW